MKTHVGGGVEAGVDIKSGNLGNVLLGKVEVGAVEVLDENLLAAGLGNDGEAALGGPAQEDLGVGLAVLVGNLADDVVLEERSEGLGVGEVELVEGGRAEGGVGGDGDTLVLGEADEVGLDEVGVVLDLKGGGADLGVAEEVVDQLALEVGNANGAGKTLLNEALHGAPGLLNGGVGAADLGDTVVEPAGRVADRGVDVLEGNGEVDDVEVEVVDAKIAELLASHLLDVLRLVVGVPEFGDEEELLTLDEAILDGAGDALADLNLVAVVCPVSYAVSKLSQKKK